MFLLIFLIALWSASFTSTVILILISASLGSIIGSGLVFVGLSITMAFVGYLQVK